MNKSKILVSLFACTLLLTGCFEDEQQSNAEPRPIAWMRTISNDMGQVRRISGVLQATESANLSFEVGGKVKTVNVSLSDVVKKGDVLADLDESSYRLTTKAAQGNLQEARAKLTEAQNEFQRQSNLHKQGWVSKAAYDNAKAALDSATSAVDVAQAELDLTNKDLGDTALKAPYDGKITARLMEPSQQVSAGETVITIEGEQGLEVSVLIPETIISNLVRGNVYMVKFPAAPNLSIEGKVTEISSQAESANAYSTTLLLTKEHPSLRAGMTAEVDFTFKDKETEGTNYQGSTVTVPPTAILPGADQKLYVFVFDENEKVVRKREISAESVINNEIIVSKGLKPGEIIATAGVVYLNEGQAVKLIDVGVKTFN